MKYNISEHRLRMELEDGVLKYFENGTWKNISNGVVVLWVPTQNDYEELNNNPIFLNHNKEVFKILSTSTEPVIVFLKEYCAEKPYSQTAIRMRHLHEIGEGDLFFAFGYPVAHTTEDKYGLLAFSDDMYSLKSDGSVMKIDLLGNNVWGSPVEEVYYSHYNQGLYKPNAMQGDIVISIGSENTEIIVSEDDSTLTIKNLFGNTNDPEITVLNGDELVIDTVNDETTITIDQLGPVTLPIILVAEKAIYNETEYVIGYTLKEPISIYDGSGTLDSFTLTRLPEDV